LACHFVWFLTGGANFRLPFDFFLTFHYHFGLPNTHCGLPFGRWQAAISSPAILAEKMVSNKANDTMQH